MTEAGDDPVNESDPTGLCVSTPFGCVGPGPANGISGTLGAAWNDTGGKAVSAVNQHWRGVAQVATVAAVGIATAGCIEATADLCALALPELGGLTNVALVR